MNPQPPAMNPQPEAGRCLKKARTSADRTQTEVGEYLYGHGFARAHRVWNSDRLINLVDDVEANQPWPAELDFAHFAWLCVKCIGARGGPALTKLALLGNAWTIKGTSPDFFAMWENSFVEPEPSDSDTQPDLKSADKSGPRADASDKRSDPGAQQE